MFVDPARLITLYFHFTLFQFSSIQVCALLCTPKCSPAGRILQVMCTSLILALPCTRRKVWALSTFQSFMSADPTPLRAKNSILMLRSWNQPAAFPCEGQICSCAQKYKIRSHIVATSAPSGMQVPCPCPYPSPPSIPCPCACPMGLQHNSANFYSDCCTRSAFLSIHSKSRSDTSISRFALTQKIR